jgi:hypothetical protein
MLARVEFAEVRSPEDLDRSRPLDDKRPPTSVLAAAEAQLSLSPGASCTGNSLVAASIEATGQAQ